MVLSQRSVTVRLLPVLLTSGCYSPGFMHGFLAGAMVTSATIFVVVWFLADK